LWGTWGGRSFLRAFERKVSFFIIHFIEEFDRNVKKAIETGNSFHRGPRWGAWRGSFTGTFERQMKEGSGNGTSLIKLIWAPFLLIQVMLGA
jgi:hypothetical protein